MITPAEVVGWAEHIESVVLENGAENHSYGLFHSAFCHIKLGPIETGD
jgi:hypothetical protein